MLLQKKSDRKVSKKMHIRTLSLVLLGLVAAQPSSATQVFTDTTSFLGQVIPGYYLETFDGLSEGHNQGQELDFSQNGYSYVADASGGPFPFNAQFYSLQGQFPGDLVDLSGNLQLVTLTFTFSSNVTAVGGTFFMTDGSSVTTGTMDITLADGTDELINAGAPFFGFTSPTPITSLTLTSNRMTTVNDLIVGSSAEAPEPGTLWMMPAVALMLFARLYRRSKYGSLR
jgi:hypothetical protein